MEIVEIPLGEIEQNVGQIDGLPKNPRQWTRKDLDALKKSIDNLPELLELRGLIVYPHNGKYVILGGNMRYEALKGLKAKSAPCMIVDKDMSLEKLKKIVITDNGSFGEWDWDELANMWDDCNLEEMGLDIPALKESATSQLSQMEYSPMYYEPEQKPNLRLIDCVDFGKYEAKVQVIEESDLTEEQKEVLRVFAYRFIKIDFESVANYYAFNASEEEKKVIERLRLVLVDNGSIGGFIEDDMLKATELVTIGDESDED